MSENTFTRRYVACRAALPQDDRSQMARRVRAASRLVPLDCGCRETITCRCTEPTISNRALDGWAAAARYVLVTSGKTPMVPIEVLRALYRRGGQDRELAIELWDLTNGEVA